MQVYLRVQCCVKQKNTNVRTVYQYISYTRKYNNSNIIVSLNEFRSSQTAVNII